MKKPARRTILSFGKKFAAGLGLEEATLGETEKQPETNNLIDTFRSICRDGSTAQGLAALYAYESQIPEICESKIDGLKKHYSFENPEHYEYFTVHLEADREHRAAERALLENHVTDENSENVQSSTGRALAALWEMLSGVCRRHALAC